MVARTLSAATLAFLANSVLSMPTKCNVLSDDLRSRSHPTLTETPVESAQDEDDAVATGGPGGWAGAVFGSKTGVATVAATMTVPTPSIPSEGTNSQYGGTGWVGIDGYGIEPLWQTGVVWEIDAGGSPNYYGWWDWYSDGKALTVFSGFNVTGGDVIAMQVVASSPTSGTATLENLTTGQTVNQTLTDQIALHQTTAEWIVEDYGQGGGSVPFAAYAPAVAFTGCVYTDSTGSSLGLSGVDVLDTISGTNGNAFTHTVQNSENAITVTYTGNGASS